MSLDRVILERIKNIFLYKNSVYIEYFSQIKRIVQQVFVMLP